MLTEANASTTRPEASSDVLAGLPARCVRRVRRIIARKLLRAIVREACFYSGSGEASGDTPPPTTTRGAVPSPPSPHPLLGEDLHLAGAPSPPYSQHSADPTARAEPDDPDAEHRAVHDGVAAMFSILAALQDGDRSSVAEVLALTGLDPTRLTGHALNLKDDGYLIFEREETLRLTALGEAALEEFTQSFRRCGLAGRSSCE